MAGQMKAVLRGLAFAVMSPWILWFCVKRLALGRDRALQGSAQALALLPGLPGQYLRRALLSVALDRCAPTAVVEFGTTFSQAGTRLEDHVYVGPMCSLGLVHLESYVLVAGGVHIPSGPDTHGTEQLGVPIREQPGTRQLVRVGQGAWIGNGAIVMADVGRDAIVGAGAVVTTPIPDRAIAAGVPARVIRTRGDA
jgi:virginiamycin A acetyltransferase